MFLWLGLGLSQTFLSDVFGVQNISHVDTERSAIPVIDNPLNKAIHQVLSKVQKERSHTMRVNRNNLFILNIILSIIIFSAFNY